MSGERLYRNRFTYLNIVCVDKTITPCVSRYIYHGTFTMYHGTYFYGCYETFQPSPFLCHFRESYKLSFCETIRCNFSLSNVFLKTIIKSSPKLKRFIVGKETIFTQNIKINFEDFKNHEHLIELIVYDTPCRDISQRQSTHVTQLTIMIQITFDYLKIGIYQSQKKFNDF